MDTGYWHLDDDLPISAIPVRRDKGLQGRADFLTGADGDKPLTNILVLSVWDESGKVREAGRDEYRELVEENPGGATILFPRESPGPEGFCSKVHKDERFDEISPLPLRNALDTKSGVYKILSENGIPTIPTEDVQKPYLGRPKWTEDSLGKKDDLIIKPEHGAGGQLVERHTYETYEELIEQNTILNESFKDLPVDIAPDSSRIIQPYIEHEREIRVYVNEDGVLSGEVKYGLEDDYRCNLSQLEGGSPREEAAESVEQNAAKPVTEGMLPEAVRNLGEEFCEILGEYSEGGEAVGNLDVMEAKEDLSWMPEGHSGVQEESSGNSYLVVEAHACYGGDIGDRLHFNSGNPESMPVYDIGRRLGLEDEFGDRCEEFYPI